MEELFVSYEVALKLEEKDFSPKKCFGNYYYNNITDKSSPSSYSRYSSITKKMKISLDGGATLELPFTPGILEDNFLSYIAKLIIANSRITFDVKDFNEDMFPENEECHC
jgi:hypothetical protein